MYDVLQDDLAGLVSPSCIVVCEGKKSSEGTDARIYNKVFEQSHPDTLFISRGSSTEIEKGEIIPVLESIVPSRLRKKGKVLSRSVLSLNCLGGIRHVIGQFD